MTTSLGTLLIVDDEELNRDMLSRRLELEGYSVKTAASGAETLRLLTQERFDALLLDVMMPVQNGYEVLAEIRKQYTPLELPVLMVTAKNQNEDVVNAFEVGANDYITKPINFPVALARIKCHVSSKLRSSQLRESEARFSLSARGANDGLWDWDLITDSIYFSARWKTMLGYAEHEVGDSIDEWFSRVHPEDLPHMQRALAAHRAGKSDLFESEHRMRHKDQTYRWTLTRGVAIKDNSGQQYRMAGSQTDITRGKAADPLTGLPNRVLFVDHLDRAIQNAGTESGDIFAVLFLDLDRFKNVNDSLGHQAGDELLVTVARRLENCMRSAEVVRQVHVRSMIARFGGDEFVVLLNGISAPGNAMLVAERILSELTEPLSLQGHTVPISCSIGIAVGQHAGCTANDLLRDADIAMYRAKSLGKSRACLFDESMRSSGLERLALEADLKSALEKGEFRVFYQPIVALPSERIEGFESLVRWQHPARGLIEPQEFVPIAEETGMIIELGDWVLEQACRQLGQWLRRHPEQAPLFISVNISSKQFADPHLIERVSCCLQRTGLNPGMLKLEITESAIMRDPEAAAQTLVKLQRLGVHISLDDFGTGYSSLSYLQQLPIDTIKIDRSFTGRVETSKQAGEIVKTIVGLAHRLGIHVTAEGIERREQLQRLNEFSCETGQGYLYCRPVPKASIEELLSELDRPGLPESVVAEQSFATLPHEKRDASLCACHV